MTDMLVLGDPHAHPDYENSRFEWLGQLILDRKPDIIYCVGDLADMPSLSSYDKGTKGFEGRRYRKDIEAAIDAQEKMFGPVKKWNEKQAKNRKAQYHPRKIITKGNHTFRVDRAVNSQPELEGTISDKDLQLDLHWDEVYDFKTTALVEGFALSHYFAGGLMARPISGECPADACLKKLGMSNISGHSHLLDIKMRTRPTGDKMLSIVAGCYVHPQMIDDWNKNTANLWWSGVILLHDVASGYAEGIETITQDRIKRLYA